MLTCTCLACLDWFLNAGAAAYSLGLWSGVEPMMLLIYIIKMYIHFCRISILCFLMLLVPFQSRGGESDFTERFSWFWGFQMHEQQLLAHHASMKPYTSNTIRAFELLAGARTVGAQDWEHLYNFPAYGLGFFYSDLGYGRVMGQTYSGFAFLEFPVRRYRCLGSHVKYSLGLAHFTRLYHPEHNPDNAFIGTPWNVHFNINYQLGYDVHQQYRFFGGTSFTHYSNGSYRKPNKGLNLLDFNLGMRYYFRERSMVPLASDYELYSNLQAGKRQWHVGLGLGAMQRNIEGPVYKTSCLSVNTSRPSGKTNRWGLGLDVFVYEETREQVNHLFKNPGFLQYSILGAHLSHDIVFNRMAVLMQLGAYAYSELSTPQPVYQRVGLRYLLPNQISLGLALKTHYARAEVVEWGLGYVF